MMIAVINPKLEGSFTAAGESFDTMGRESYPQLPDRFHEAFRAVYYLLQHRLKKRPDNELPPEDLARYHFFLHFAALSCYALSYFLLPLLDAI